MLCNFSKDDVLILAKAVIEDPLVYSSGDYVSYFYCQYCNAELHGHQCHANDFKHDLNCPVLVAQDILTGQKPKTD